MANRRLGWLACAGTILMLSGCVERRFIIETNPPGTKVYVNNRPVGFTPVDVPFTYYGNYLITLEAPGYQTKTFEQNVSAAWHGFPPLDFFAENLWPFKISDVRHLSPSADGSPSPFEMTPLPRPNLDQLRYDGEELRKAGQNLPEPSVPVEPRNRREPVSATPPPVPNPGN